MVLVLVHVAPGEVSVMVVQVSNSALAKTVVVVSVDSAGLYG